MALHASQNFLRWKNWLGRLGIFLQVLLLTGFLFTGPVCIQAFPCACLCVGICVGASVSSCVSVWVFNDTFLTSVFQLSTFWKNWWVSESHAKLSLLFQANSSVFQFQTHNSNLYMRLSTKSKFCQYGCHWRPLLWFTPLNLLFTINFCNYHWMIVTLFVCYSKRWVVVKSICTVPTYYSEWTAWMLYKLW